MKKSDIDHRPKTHPIFNDLPKHLKDPANFHKIQKTILESLATGHSHSEIVDWAACADCQKKFFNKGKVMQGLGFKNMPQYMAWRKVMETIHGMGGEKSPMEYYDTKK